MDAGVRHTGAAGDTRAAGEALLLAGRTVHPPSSYNGQVRCYFPRKTGTYDSSKLWAILGAASP